ncbi:SRPBCC family protein [Franconibacter helveticus]|uniref:SRPBCC family protein n=1 Tax=Franconibacter helveticus TaxID=357240 RepID=UPI000DA1DC84|nr:SRPBCC family protein [Franconibacter helveticus]
MQQNAENTRTDARQEEQGLRRSILIHRSPEELYHLWRDPGTLPRIMHHFAIITILSDTSSRWQVKLPLGRKLEWDAHIVDEQPGRYISWASDDNASVPNAGRLSFQPVSDERGTEVTLAMHFDPPGGFLGEWLSKKMDVVPEAMLSQALRRFKSLAETGEIATNVPQPAGRHGGMDKAEE